MKNKENHPQLAGLKALWNLPDETLNKILWANTVDSNIELEKPLAIGLACQYIEYMEEFEGTSNPAEAWESWCIQRNIEHEIENNPYL